MAVIHDPSGGPARAPDIPWANGVPPFPQVPWSQGQGIPDPIRDWLHQTIRPLASWYTQTRSHHPGVLEGMPGGISDWAANPMQAIQQANLPPALRQGIFDYGVGQFHGAGVGDPSQWAPDGEAYRLWSQFLGMDHPQQIGGGANVDQPPVPPNPQLPQPQQRPTVDASGGQMIPLGTGQVLQGALSMGRPVSGGPGQPYSGGPPTRFDPSQWEWLRSLQQGGGVPATSETPTAYG
jgi:hypothetical protein